MKNFYLHKKVTRKTIVFSFIIELFIVFSILYFWIRGKTISSIHDKSSVGCGAFYLEPYKLNHGIENALFMSKGDSAQEVSMHYLLSTFDMREGTRWMFIAAKLGNKHALKDWVELSDFSVFSINKGEEEKEHMTAYDHYICYMSMFLRGNVKEASVHLKRLRELGVTEKLLENPLVLPGMEDAP